MVHIVVVVLAMVFVILGLFTVVMMIRSLVALKVVDDAVLVWLVVLIGLVSEESLWIIIFFCCCFWCWF